MGRLRRLIFCFLAAALIGSMISGCGTSGKKKQSTETVSQTESIGTTAKDSNGSTSNSSNDSMTDSEFEKKLESEEYTGSTEVVLSDDETGGFH